MIIVKVTNRVKSEFAPKNQQNIQTFIEDLRKLSGDDFRYSAYVCEDGRTFVHHSKYKSEAIQKQVLAVESFKAFQQQRDASGLEGSHNVEVMNLAASSFAMFN